MESQNHIGSYVYDIHSTHAHRTIFQTNPRRNEPSDPSAPEERAREGVHLEPI